MHNTFCVKTADQSGPRFVYFWLNLASKGLAVLLTVLAFSCTVRAQATTLSYAKDTIIHPRFKRAAFQLALAEVIPFTVDRYIRNVDYAHISFSSIGHNLKPSSWSWDDDAFGTNQFAHPYHGSQYFSAFRANGYSFWQAAPATLVGSYVWETFAEKQYPAPNDFINTSFGGIVLGEMTYRLSNQIVNNRTRGLKRHLSEVLAMMVNPINGLNRLLDGKWGKVDYNTRERDSTYINAEFDLGVRKFKADHHGKIALYGHVRLLYGTPFENYRTPFSNISVNAEFGSDDSSKVNIVSVYGSLAGWKMRQSGFYRHMLTLSANYDYIHNEAFFYSAQSVKLNLFSEFGLLKICRIYSSIGAGPVLLAAVPDKYFFKGRNYDYTAGAGIYANIRCTLFNKLFCRLNYRGGLLKTINGNESHYTLQAATSEIGYRLTDHFSACAEPGYFYLHGNYKHFNNVVARYPYLRVSLRYNVDFN